VVGADGIHSAVRGYVAGAVVPRFARQIVWRSLAPLRLPEPPGVQFWLGEGCFFGLCPVSAGRSYGFGNVTHPREHDPVEGRLERLRGRFAGFGPAVQDYLQRLERDEQLHCSPIEWVEQAPRPRVTWVHQQSRAIADGFRQPPPARDRALRERGAAMLRHRFASLTQEP
jgi:2-polyprenyl-6-methoxyphenol hydroxylase-like FAD-dependent oxidoreductase